jgi:hypothetical protein
MSGTLRPSMLSEQECLRLLGSVAAGRLVYTARALPAVLPARHAVVGRVLVVGVHDDDGIARAVLPGAVVAYESEGPAPDGDVAWYVTAWGVARFVRASTHPPLPAQPREDAQDGCAKLEVRIEVLAARGRRTAG